MYVDAVMIAEIMRVQKKAKSPAAINSYAVSMLLDKTYQIYFA